jgi:hypothetical protein
MTPLDNERGAVISSNIGNGGGGASIEASTSTSNLCPAPPGGSLDPDGDEKTRFRNDDKIEQGQQPPASYRGGGTEGGIIIASAIGG